jgi:hypothetical protein
VARGGVGAAALGTTLDRWPSADRGSADDFFRATFDSLGAQLATPADRANASSAACLSYQPAELRKGAAAATAAAGAPHEYVYPEGLGLRRYASPRKNAGAYVVVDAGHRAIYVGNLKAASSTITKKIMESGLNANGSRTYAMVRARVSEGMAAIHGAKTVRDAHNRHHVCKRRVASPLLRRKCLVPTLVAC